MTTDHQTYYDDDRDERLTPGADLDDGAEITRPWAPRFQDAEDADADAAGRPKGVQHTEPPRDAPMPPKQQEEPGGLPKVCS